MIPDKKMEYVSNVEERLRQIKQISTRFAYDAEDFIDLTMLKK